MPGTRADATGPLRRCSGGAPVFVRGSGAIRECKVRRAVQSRTGGVGRGSAVTSRTRERGDLWFSAS
jgi:hypothetical protein